MNVGNRTQTAPINVETRANKVTMKFFAKFVELQTISKLRTQTQPNGKKIIGESYGSQYKLSLFELEYTKF